MQILKLGLSSFRALTVAGLTVVLTMVIMFQFWSWKFLSAKVWHSD